MAVESPVAGDKFVGMVERMGGDEKIGDHALPGLGGELPVFQKKSALRGADPASQKVKDESASA